MNKILITGNVTKCVHCPVSNSCPLTLKISIHPKCPLKEFDIDGQIELLKTPGINAKGLHIKVLEGLKNERN